MFRTFSAAKAGRRGQLTPFFIVLITALVIAALVTINIGKVALNKTYVANASDAGSLAGASVMASVFNNIAVANSQMKVAYQDFVTATAVLYAAALAALIVSHKTSLASLSSAKAAATKACKAPCVAAGMVATAIGSLGKASASMGIFITTLKSIGIAITSFSVAQLFLYNIIRKMAAKGRKDAIKLAYRYLFINSGITSRLNSGQRDKFSDWLDSSDVSNVTFDKASAMFAEFNPLISHIKQRFPVAGSGRRYHWKDGWEKNHIVQGFVKINKVDKFIVRITALPYPAQIALLIGMGKIASDILAQWVAVGDGYGLADDSLIVACGCDDCCPHPACCACRSAACAGAEEELGIDTAAHSAANAQIIPLYPLLTESGVGLAPAASLRSSSGFNLSWATIVWIDDVVHDRGVYVLSFQLHQGKDLGLWQEKYPVPLSFSVADFRGSGRISPPKLGFDARIVRTDISGKGALSASQRFPLKILRGNLKQKVQGGGK